MITTFEHYISNNMEQFSVCKDGWSTVSFTSCNALTNLSLICVNFTSCNAMTNLSLICVDLTSCNAMTNLSLICVNFASCNALPNRCKF